MPGPASPRANSAAVRHCARPGCRGDAVATMSYDHGSAVVYIGQLTPERHPSYYDLCRTHVDALSAPKGWAVRREPLVLAGADGNTDAWHTTRDAARNAI
jgi:Protein of unknown function (DUF3499)